LCRYFVTQKYSLLATKTRELKKRSLFVKKLVSQNAPRLKEGMDLFFNKEGKRAARKKKKISDGCFIKQKRKRERER